MLRIGVLSTKNGGRTPPLLSPQGRGGASGTRRRRSQRRVLLRLAGALVLAGEQRRDAAHGDAAVGAFRHLRRHLEILLAVALRRQVLGRDAEALRERERRGFGAAIRQ